MKNLDVFATRTATKTGAELDAIEHKRHLVFNHGERNTIKTAIRRRSRRQTRQALRLAY